MKCAVKLATLEKLLTEKFVSIVQAVGASTPAFTAGLSLLIKPRESVCTHAALLPVVAGIVIATGAEPCFHLAGFGAAVAATAARACKSVLHAGQQLL